MFLKISKKDLQAALKKVTGIIDTKAVNSITNNVLICVNATGNFTVTATCREVELSYTQSLPASDYEVNTISEFQFLTPAHKLLKICAKLSDVVVFTFENDKLSIKSGKSSFNLQNFPVEDFPHFEGFDVSHDIQTSQAELKHRLELVSTMAGVDNVKFYLNGICLDIKNDGQLCIVTTDGHRLAINSTPFDNGDREPIQAILPNNACKELMKNLESIDDSVKILLSNMWKHCKIELSSGFSLCCNLIDHQFPEYTKVIPSPKFTAVIDTTALNQAISHVRVLSNEKYRGIQFQFSENRLKVYARNPEQEEATEDIDIVYEGKNVNIGFNADYVKDVLDVIKTPAFKFMFTDPNESCKFVPNTTQEQALKEEYVVMPMRL